MNAFARACRRVLPCVVAGLALGVARPATALEAQVTELRVSGKTVRAAIELKDVFVPRFRQLLDQGGTLHLRVECELWEVRAIWDRLVRGGNTAVFRLTRDAAARTLTVEDASGTVASYPLYPGTLVVWIDVAPGNRIDDAKRYYVRATAIVGTIAESEIEGMSDAVFGTGNSGGLEALGREFMRRALKLADYLESATAKTTSRKVSGKEVKSGR